MYSFQPKYYYSLIPKCQNKNAKVMCPTITCFIVPWKVISSDILISVSTTKKQYFSMLL